MISIWCVTVTGLRCSVLLAGDVLLLLFALPAPALEYWRKIEATRVICSKMHQPIRLRVLSKPAPFALSPLQVFLESLLRENVE